MRLRIRGFSAIEIAIVLVAVAVVAMLAAPSFGGLSDRQRVRAAVSNLGVDIQYARSEAVRKNAPITVSFAPGATPWCYGIVNGTAACLCNTAGSCDVKTVSGDDFRNVTMTLTGGTGFTIDPRQGQASAIAGGGSGAATTAIAFASSTTANAQAQVNVNALGRVAPGTPGGALPGYPTCPP
jgi:Tfp pilus assembly protein FimT